ncbi:phosphatase PAP2 family protein [Streptomyces sp. J2-1]|uniref:phosphatase PAP2 family protein n=1 Tax=Streptomyces corallincola TaxID=2851888 RepID=UPI001C38BF06|nr:phosphatase PAP2 family protein [Streptomyces corallincola]MBV2352854.1 phosphatase PAP2 family protein [Streptomyces corallincola]
MSDQPTHDRPSHRREPRDRAIVGAVVLAVCSALLLALVAARWRPLMDLDGAVARGAHGPAVRDHALTHALRVLSDWVWDPLTMRLLCVVAVVWLVWRRSMWWTAMWLATTVAVSAVVQQALKAAVGRPRPHWSDPVAVARYAAFPSGHAMTATVVCGLLLWLLHRYGAARPVRRTALAVAVVSVLGVGLTRVWLGVHWLSDVVGGWLLGALLVAVAVAVLEGRTRTGARSPRR